MKKNLKLSNKRLSISVLIIITRHISKKIEIKSGLVKVVINLVKIQK